MKDQHSSERAIACRSEAERLVKQNKKREAAAMYRQLAAIYCEERLLLFALSAYSKVLWLDPSAEDVKRRIASIRASLGMRTLAGG